MLGPSFKSCSAFVVLVAVVLVAHTSACPAASDAGDGVGGGDGEGEGEGEGEDDDTGVPDVSADQVRCEAGVVRLGDTAECTLTLRNRGTGVATLQGASTSAPFAIVDDVNGPLLPGAVDTAILTVRATPSESGVVEGAVAIQIAEIAAPLSIPARVTGQCVPVVHATAPARALVHDVVTVDASASTLCGNGPVALQFAIVSQPAGAAVDVGQLDADAMTFTLSSGTTGVVELAVVLSQDGFSSDSETVRVSFDPRFSFTVDDALLDGLEPHVFRVGDARCGASDCFDLAGCGFTASAPPEWDGEAGRGAGDPLFDEVTGSVRAAALADGTYVVAVYARDLAAADVDVTTSLVLDGVVTTPSRTLPAHAFWTVAEIVVAGGAASASSIDSIEADTSCP